MNYLYNGVELPELPMVPGYDNSVMVMTLDDEPLAECVLSTKPLSYRNYNGHGFVTTEESDYIVFILNTASPREWGKFKEGHYDGCPAYNSVYANVYGMWWNFGQDGTTAWANHDVYSLNTGERVIEKSDPIPVGSAPEVEPKSFMAGWRMGQFIRGMRG